MFTIWSPESYFTIRFLCNISIIIADVFWVNTFLLLDPFNHVHTNFLCLEINLKNKIIDTLNIILCSLLDGSWQSNLLDLQTIVSIVICNLLQCLINTQKLINCTKKLLKYLDLRKNKLFKNITTNHEQTELMETTARQPKK